MSTATIEKQTTSHECKTAHTSHLTDEGFPSEQVDRWREEGKIFSICEEKARAMGFKVWDASSKEWKSGSGLFLQFADRFGQVRLDTPIRVTEKSGKVKTVKYLTPHKVESQLMMSEGARAWTEGWKDAQAGSVLGEVPTVGATGLSHYKKFPEGAGLITIADSDAWHNASVFNWLFNSGLHQRGKCAIVPLPPGDKAGLVEFFKSVKAENGDGAEKYRTFLDSALSPTELLLQWPDMWTGASQKQIVAMTEKAIKLAREHLSQSEQTALVNKIAKASSYTRSDINKMMRQELKKDEDAKINLDDREARYKPFCENLGLDYRNCATATTFDQFVYRKFDGKRKGGNRKWVVIDQSFYKLSEDNSHWQLQDDLEIQRKIATVGEKAFKLRVTGEGEAEPSFPYECDKHTKSAFAYSRTRLHCQQPDNAHLISFKNGTLDTRTGKFRDHDPSELLTRHIPHDYTPGEECPGAFSLFIKESFGEEMLPIIRAFTAMFLDPSAPYSRFPHLIGQSGGGKGTLGRFWNSLYGENGSGSACSFEEIATAEKRHQNLTGKSIWGIADIGGYVSGLRAFYELVDNGEMSGRALYSANGYNKRWGTRFWVASVDHLQIENAGDGWKRRAYPIPVRNRAVKPDPFLRQALEDCKAAVISWALAMSKEERDEILVGQPSVDVIKNAVREAELYSDSVRTFVDLTLRPCKGAVIDNVEMHSIYVAFCKQFGYSSSNFNKFISHLKTVLPQNRVERQREKKRDGRWGWAAPYWDCITHVNGAFADISQQPDPSTGYQNTIGKDEPQWICNKSKAREGGLDKFEEFWANEVKDGGTKVRQGFESFKNPPNNSEGLDPPQDGGTKIQQGFESSEQALVHHQNHSYVTQCTAIESSCHDHISMTSANSYTFVHHQNETFLGGENFSKQTGAKNFSSGESLNLVVYEPVREENDAQEPEIADAVGTLVELANSSDVKREILVSVLSVFSSEEQQEIRQRLPEDVLSKLAATCRGQVVKSLELPEEPIYQEAKEEVVEELPETVKPVESEVAATPLIPNREIKFDPTNYNGFPWERETGWQPGEDRERTRQKKSEELRDALLEVCAQDDMDRIFMKWGNACIRWVDANLLTPQEVAGRRNLLESIANSEQQSLPLDSTPGATS
ncbi:MAG: hypothetical protein SWY16_26465 [Cyanobacteriota bacterium]|nr:hypothetical protein [Cyanobacteriota bacterium]